jgi:hypothetical protein
LPAYDLDDLPPLVDTRDAEHLMKRVHAAARPGERQAFRAVLFSAYQASLELESLYREVPGVLSGDEPAIDYFRSILGSTAPDAGDVPGRGSVVAFTPNPDPVTTNCRPTFFYRPEAIGVLVDAIDLVSGGDKTSFAVMTDALDRAWRRAEPLETIFSHARDSRRPDRLGEHLRLMARDSGIGIGRAPITGDDGPARADDIGVWPPESPPGGDSPTIIWPPDRPRPGIPRDDCELVRDVCRTMILGGAARLILPLPSAAHARGITSISPRSACSGELLTIHGSGLGSRQPADLEVRVSGSTARVDFWSDTEIRVRVPADAGPGCVGFFNRRIEEQRRQLHDQNRAAREEIAEGLSCFGRGVPLRSYKYTVSAVPCTGVNRFDGTDPVIHYFQVNGSDEATAAVGDRLVLSWDVDNAESIRIRQIYSGGVLGGPPVDVVDPPGSRYDLGIVTEPSVSGPALYELTATNDCGSVSSRARVYIGQEPAFSVVGIELVQAIQEFDFQEPLERNTVKLAANRLTLARVYVDPGDQASPAELTGQLVVNGRTVGRFAAAPYPGRRLEETNRTDILHSLNFLIPPELLSGQVAIMAQVWALGAERSPVREGLSDPRWWRQDRTLVARFLPTRPQEFVCVRVRETQRDLPPPSVADFQAATEMTRAAYPLPDDGIAIRRHLVHTTDLHLQNEGDWFSLLDELDDIAGDSQEWDVVWAAVVQPVDFILPGDKWPPGGIGRAGHYYYPDDYRHRTLAFQSDQRRAFAHELGHTFGVHHTRITFEMAGVEIETGQFVPPDVIEDVGIQFREDAILPPYRRGTREFMRWDGTGEWISIATWNYLFGRLQ